MATKEMLPFEWDVLEERDEKVLIFFRTQEDAKHFSRAAKQKIGTPMSDVDWCVADARRRFVNNPYEMTYVTVCNKEIRGWHAEHKAHIFHPHKDWYLYDPFFRSSAAPDVEDLI